MSTSTTRASMASTASSSTTRAWAFGRRVGEATGSRAGARRGPRVPAGGGRARPARRPRVSVVTYALAGADDADVPKDASAPRRLKIFSVNDGASPREARERRRFIRTFASLERIFLVFTTSRARDVPTRDGRRGGARAPATASLASRSRRVGAKRDARASRFARTPASRPAVLPRLGLGLPGKTSEIGAQTPRVGDLSPKLWSTLSVLTFSPFQKNGKQCTSSRTSPP